MQLPLASARGWGGRRKGAGRKPRGRPSMPHVTRPKIDPRYPVQVTVGKRGLAEGSVDLKLRATGERSHATVADTVQAVERLLQTAP